MNDPNYVYQPWSQERKAAASARAKAWQPSPERHQVDRLERARQREMRRWDYCLMKYGKRYDWDLVGALFEEGMSREDVMSALGMHRTTLDYDSPYRRKFRKKPRAHFGGYNGRQ